MGLLLFVSIGVLLFFFSNVVVGIYLVKSMMFNCVHANVVGLGGGLCRSRL